MKLIRGKNRFSTIISICFLGMFLITMITTIKIYNSAYMSASLISFVYILNYLGIATVPLVKNTGKGFIVTLGTYASIMTIHKLIIYPSITSIIELIHIIAVIALFIVSVLMYKEKTIVKKIWFVPTILMSAYIFTVFILVGRFEILDLLFVWFIPKLIELVGILYIGLFFKTEMIAIANEGKEETNINYNKNTLENDYSQIIGSADKIKLYQELFDSGALSEEEFNTKKKNALNL